MSSDGPSGEPDPIILSPAQQRQQEVFDQASDYQSLMRRATQKAIDSLKEVPIESMSTEERECNICLATMAEPDAMDGEIEYPVRVDVCGHIFGRTCLSIWWEKNHSCPICRRVVDSEVYYPEKSASLGSASTPEDFGPLRHEDHINEPYAVSNVRMQPATHLGAALASSATDMPAPLGEFRQFGNRDASRGRAAARPLAQAYGSSHVHGYTPGESLEHQDVDSDTIPDGPDPLMASAEARWAADIQLLQEETRAGPFRAPHPQSTVPTRPGTLITGPPSVTSAQRLRGHGNGSHAERDWAPHHDDAF